MHYFRPKAIFLFNANFLFVAILVFPLCIRVNEIFILGATEQATPRQIAAIEESADVCATRSMEEAKNHNISPSNGKYAIWSWHTLTKECAIWIVDQTVPKTFKSINLGMSFSQT